MEETTSSQSDNIVKESEKTEELVEDASSLVEEEEVVDTSSDYEYDNSSIEYETSDDSDASDSDDEIFGDDLVANEKIEWKDDFKTFAGFEEVFYVEIGAVIKDADPIQIFYKIWDKDIMETIVRETNRFAKQRTEIVGSNWDETDVDEMYIFLALNAYSMIVGGAFESIWQGFTKIACFSKTMPYNRFKELLTHLHFVNNDELPRLDGYLKKLAKVKPLMTHCNKKFGSLFVPGKYLTVAESILLWRGRFYLNKCLAHERTFCGMKAYELRDRKTDYVLKYEVLCGVHKHSREKPLQYFNKAPMCIVKQLIEPYLDRGHCLILQTVYNDIGFTRYLKSRRTDLISTVNRHKANVPEEIKALKYDTMTSGQIIFKHCGDVTVVAWKENGSVVTLVSTYHTNSVIPSATPRPSIAEDFLFQASTEDEEDKFKEYGNERNRKLKWYLQEFRRILKISLRNAYVIYRTNCDLKPMRLCDFITEVAMELRNRHKKVYQHKRKHST